MTYPPLNRDMTAYYRERAAAYDEVYAIQARLPDQLELRGWLAEQVRGQSVLEVAAGTGYWTLAAAGTARSIIATDVNREPLAQAESKNPGPHVTFRTADAFDLSVMLTLPEVGMAHLWWSHVKRQDQARFLHHLRSRLQPQARLLMIDEQFVPGLSTPISRRDADGNSWQSRMLASGALFEVVKNYPDPDALRRDLDVTCEQIAILSLAHFWAVSAVFR